jgi:arsenate reductase
MKVYGYTGCGTCRKAWKWLDAKGIAYSALAIRETPPSVAELKQVLTAVGGDLKRLFNTSGGDYKALDLKSKLPGMAVEEALALLSANGNLCKRPLVLGQGVALVGFKVEEWEAALG